MEKTLKEAPVTMSSDRDPYVNYAVPTPEARIIMALSVLPSPATSYHLLEILNNLRELPSRAFHHVRLHRISHNLTNSSQCASIIWRDDNVSIASS